jgi:hypothetical protein
MQRLRLKPYLAQSKSWPKKGRMILAQFDEQTVVVYQAFSRKMGAYAARHGKLGGDRFSFEQMSWIKTNFMMMMDRSGWGSQRAQEAVLAIWLRREAFDAILAEAVSSAYTEGVYGDQEAWKRALAQSEVRLQWDPDYNPRGIKLDRRAIQLGLSGATLHRYAEEWIDHIEDISSYVREQSKFVRQPEMLLTPAEQVYPVKEQLARRLGLDMWAG